MEQFKDIEGYEGKYKVSNTGLVFSVKAMKVLAERRRGPRGGYLCCALYKNGIRKEESAHRLVAKAFLENKENYAEVNHKDGNKLNNNVDNLEWCSSEYNRVHARKAGLWEPNLGVAHGGAKLNEKQVRVIKHMKNIPNRITQKRIGKIFGVGKGTVQAIFAGRQWKHIAI